MGGCHYTESQCLIYFISAPYFHAGLPFLRSNKVLKENVEKLIKAEENIRKNAKKQNPAAILQREQHETYLDQTFDAISPSYKDKVQSCPAR